MHHTETAYTFLVRMIIVAVGEGFVTHFNSRSYVVKPLSIHWPIDLILLTIKILKNYFIKYTFID